MLFRSISRKGAWAGISILALAAACPAQPSHRPVKTPHPRKAHVRPQKKTAAAEVSAATAAPAPPTPLRPLNQPAKPATITLSAGKLAVKADNSSLVQILDQLGKSGGMSITGLNQDQRVFGDYGPGNPSQILSELLEGAGYNVLMLGVTREGIPKELVLSERGNAPPSAPQSFPAQAVQPVYQQPLYQRAPVPPAPQGNLNFPGHTPVQMYQQMMKQREQQQQQPPQ